MFTNEPLPPSAEGNADQEMTTVINITAYADESNNRNQADSSESTQQVLPIPPRSLNPHDPRNCQCRSLSRYTYDKFLGQVVLPLIPKDEWDIDFADEDFTSSLPEATGTPRFDNYKILRHIFLFLPFDTETLLAAAGVNRAWRALADRLPHWKYLLPLKRELPEIVAKLNWHLPMMYVVERVPYEDGEKIFTTNYHLSKPHLSCTFDDADFHHLRLRKVSELESDDSKKELADSDPLDEKNPRPPPCSIGTWCDFLLCLPCSFRYVKDPSDELARKCLQYQNQSEASTTQESNQETNQSAELEESSPTSLLKMRALDQELFSDDSIVELAHRDTTVKIASKMIKDVTNQTKSGSSLILAAASHGEYMEVYKGALEKSIGKARNSSDRAQHVPPTFFSFEDCHGSVDATKVCCVRTSLLEYVDDIMHDADYRRRWMYPTLSSFFEETRKIIAIRSKEIQELEAAERLERYEVEEQRLADLEVCHFEKDDCALLHWKCAMSAAVVYILLFLLAVVFPPHILETNFSPTDLALGGLMFGAILFTCFATYVIFSLLSSEGSGLEQPEAGAASANALAVLLLAFLFLVPLSLLSFRLSILEDLMKPEDWIVSVVDLYKHSGLSKVGQFDNVSYLNSLYQPREPTSGSTSWVPLVDALLPVKDLDSTTFLHFPNGTQFLFHPATTSSGPIPFRAQFNANTGKTTVSNESNSLTYSSKSQLSSRGQSGYYTVFMPPSSSAYLDSITLEIFGDFDECPFWSFNDESNKIHPRFQQVLSNVSSPTAVIERASEVSAHIGEKVARRNSTSSKSCSHISNLLVTVRNTNFNLRIVNKPLPHFTSWMFTEEYDSMPKSWDEATSYSKSGVLGLMADSSILIAHENSLSPVIPSLLPSPYGASVNPSVWSQATPEGLETLYSDFHLAYIFLIVVFITCCTYSVTVHTPFARQLTRDFAEVLLAAIVVLGCLSGSALGVVCFATSVENEKDELRQPAVCLGGCQTDFLVFLYFSGIVLISLLFVFFLLCRDFVASFSFVKRWSRPQPNKLDELVARERQSRDTTETLALAFLDRLFKREHLSRLTIESEKSHRYVLVQQFIQEVSSAFNPVIQKLQLRLEHHQYKDPAVWLQRLVNDYFPDADLPVETISAFKRNHFNYDSFLMIEEADFSEMKIPIGVKRLLLRIREKELPRQQLRNGLAARHALNYDPAAALASDSIFQHEAVSSVRTRRNLGGPVHRNDDADNNNENENDDNNQQQEHHAEIIMPPPTEIDRLSDQLQNPRSSILETRSTTNRSVAPSSEWDDRYSIAESFG